MEAADSPKTLVPIYSITYYHIPEHSTFLERIASRYESSYISNNLFAAIDNTFYKIFLQQLIIIQLVRNHCTFMK